LKLDGVLVWCPFLVWYVGDGSPEYANMKREDGWMDENDGRKEDKRGPG
jgi:hypothetical protein